MRLSGPLRSFIWRLFTGSLIILSPNNLLFTFPPFDQLGSDRDRLVPRHQLTGACRQHHAKKADYNMRLPPWPPQSFTANVCRGCRSSLKVQRTSDYQSKVGFPYTLDRFLEAGDSRRKRNRVPKPCRLSILDVVQSHSFYVYRRLAVTRMCRLSWAELSAVSVRA